MSLQPLLDIHLHSRFEKDIAAHSDVAYVYLFASVAALVLLITCANFTNLATARSLDRAKEVGVKKAVGAQRGQLLGQFVGESVLCAGGALLLAFPLIWLSMPVIGALTGRQLALGFDLFTLGGMLLLTLIVGVLAGIYPAVYLSALQPITALRNTTPAGPRGDSLRKLLVTMQFAISTFLIVVAIIAYQQLAHMSAQKLGLAQDQVVVLRTSEVSASSYDALLGDFLQIPGVLHASSAFQMPGLRVSRGNFEIETAQGRQQIDIHGFPAGYNYATAMGMELVAGRDFSEDYLPPSGTAVLLNEQAARQAGWEDPIGKMVILDNGASPVVGVVADFHYESLHHVIGPLMISFSPGKNRYTPLRLKPDDLAVTLEAIEDRWRALSPDLPLEFFFLDQLFASMYQAELATARIAGLFSVVAVVVSCMGIFGLAFFAARQRKKEIGIRKALGASVSNILSLLSREFLHPLLWAILIGWPVAYYAAAGWLENFAYRVDPEIPAFALGGIATILAAVLTAGHQTFRAARANPVDGLRDE